MSRMVLVHLSKIEPGILFAGFLTLKEETKVVKNSVPMQNNNSHKDSIVPD